MHFHLMGKMLQHKKLLVIVLSRFYCVLVLIILLSTVLSLLWFHFLVLFPCRDCGAADPNAAQFDPTELVCAVRDTMLRHSTVLRCYSVCRDTALLELNCCVGSCVANVSSPPCSPFNQHVLVHITSMFDTGLLCWRRGRGLP